MTELHIPDEAVAADRRHLADELANIYGPNTSQEVHLITGWLRAQADELDGGKVKT